MPLASFPLWAWQEHEERFDWARAVLVVGVSPTHGSDTVTPEGSVDVGEHPAFLSKPHIRLALFCFRQQ